MLTKHENVDLESHSQPGCNRVLACLLCGVLLLTGSGCGDDLPQGVPISGTVTYNGEPLKGGTIYYEPAANVTVAKKGGGSGKTKTARGGPGGGGRAAAGNNASGGSAAGGERSAAGIIAADGTFKLATNRAISGVLPGEYRIAVRSYEGEVGPTDSDNRKSAANKGTGEVNRGPKKPAIPQKYFDVETSGLTDTVDEQHSGTNNIELVD